ncbi:MULTISPECIES: hypothetical protein [Streptomyces]|uniref:hypothetical protein n=1 Tax=Streptomyces TaxID=1883 RepID=UPI0020605FB5|nr:MULTISPECIES: hypothetical protein [Streptomyces]UPT41784.1 hypothetical protein MWG59_10285 [Streptomyces sp. WAC00303]WIY76016.1 hypothetical protein QPM16_10145 [Streptomyces anulatus]
MADFEVTSHRVVTVELGDVLVVGHGAQFSAEEAANLKERLGLTAIMTVPGAVDLGVVKSAGQDVTVDVTTSPDAATDVAKGIMRAVRRPRGGQ